MNKSKWFQMGQSMAGVALLSAFFAAHATPLPATGPDTFGYTGDSIANNLRNVDQSGNIIVANGAGDLSDDDTTLRDIGFSFDFYGNVYTQVAVSSNGFISFNLDTGDGCCTGGLIPDAGDLENNLIAGLWEDLDPGDTPGQGTIADETRGVAGSREYVVGFYGVPHWSEGNLVTFEMILHETSNDIELQYGVVSGDDGGDHTVGIENASGTDGLEVFRNSQSNIDFDNTGYCISHPQSGGSCVSVLEPAAVPEPASLLLLGIGLAGLGFARRSR